MSSQPFTLSQLAEKFAVEFKGDADCIITGIATITSAKPGEVTFLDNPKYRKYLADTKASAVILSQKMLKHCQTNAIITDNPQLMHAKVARLFQNLPNTTAGIHPSAVIGENCQIDASVAVGANCVIGHGVSLGQNTIIGPNTTIGERVVIGENCRLWSNVSIYYGVTIGDEVEIHSGAVIGADGFGLAQSAQGWEKIPQLGGVRIGNRVDIGANTCIDRGAIDDTTIADGVKLDNQIQIGHNVQIGENTIIAGCAAIAGSTKIGRNCMIGGGAGIVGHIEIADNVLIAAMTGISKSLDEPGVYVAGIQADKHENWRKNAVVFRHLGEIAEKIKFFEKEFEKYLKEKEQANN